LHKILFIIAYALLVNVNFSWRIKANVPLIYFSTKMKDLNFVPTIQSIRSPHVRLDYLLSIANLLEARPDELDKFYLVRLRFMCFNHT
jgi:hypothetical protein